MTVMKRRALIVALSLIAGCGGDVLADRASTNPPLKSTTTTPAPVRTTTTTPKPTTTTTPPIDLSGVNWTALAALIEEERRLVRQMEIDEARMLYGKCGEWYPLAVQVGWPAEEWATMSYVLYRESRCNTGSHNKSDPVSGSRGLLQINGYWCRPSKWSQAGWLQDKGILSTCDDLFDAEVNLRAGLAIWLYGEQKHGCGWRGPWSTPCQ